MRLKLDENLPTDLGAELTVRGHDADTVIDEGLEGQPDPVVVAAAQTPDGCWSRSTVSAIPGAESAGDARLGS